MKIRSLHPDFFTDAKVTGLSFGARILFEGLWCRSDDYGRGRMLEKAIEGDVFPRDDVDITALLDELIQAGLIRSYQSGQDRYYFIPTWERYQSPKYRAKSSIPEPPDETPGQMDPGQSGTNPGQSAQELSPGEGEGEGVTSPNGDTNGLFETFYEFWTGKAYVAGKTTVPKSMRGRINRAVKEAREAGIAAGEVWARGEQYRKTWSGMERTPQALLANWHRFEPYAEVPDCVTCGNRGLVALDAEGNPTDWDDPLSSVNASCPACAVPGGES